MFGFKQILYQNVELSVPLSPHEFNPTSSGRNILCYPEKSHGDIPNTISPEITKVIKLCIFYMITGIRTTNIHVTIILMYFCKQFKTKLPFILLFSKNLKVVQIHLNFN